VVKGIINIVLSKIPKIANIFIDISYDILLNLMFNLYYLYANIMAITVMTHKISTIENVV